jgi:hypothetical protein
MERITCKVCGEDVGQCHMICMPFMVSMMGSVENLGTILIVSSCILYPGLSSKSNSSG